SVGRLHAALLHGILRLDLPLAAFGVLEDNGAHLVEEVGVALLIQVNLASEHPSLQLKVRLSSSVDVSALVRGGGRAEHLDDGVAAPVVHGEAIDDTRAEAGGVDHDPFSAEGERVVMDALSCSGVGEIAGHKRGLDPGVEVSDLLAAAAGRLRRLASLGVYVPDLARTSRVDEGGVSPHAGNVAAEVDDAVRVGQDVGAGGAGEVHVGEEVVAGVEG